MGKADLFMWFSPLTYETFGENIWIGNGKEKLPSGQY